ncbi:MAG TPA: ATPase [Bacteroidaceae bacterium]|nr:ATPase [Bacteroidaceae bacterium]
MEKRSSSADISMKKILVTGPESAGKTDLSIFLTGYFNGRLVPEYARKYIEGLKRPYTFDDVVAIALKQRTQYHELREGDRWIIFDTWLVITKVWMDVVFNKYPDWITRELNEAKFDLVLVCAPDIPWVPDPVRENGGEQRVRLYKRYIDETERLGWRYAVVEGTGEQRYRNALDKMEAIL